MLVSIPLPPAYADELRDVFRPAEIVAFAFHLADVDLLGASLITDQFGRIEAVGVPAELAPAIEPALWLAAAFGSAGPIADYLDTDAGRDAVGLLLSAACDGAGIAWASRGLRIAHTDDGIYLFESVA